MRSFYSLSLLLLFIVNAIGGFTILCFHHYKIKEHIESILRSDNVQIPLADLEIPDNESNQLIWLKENLEFRYKGNMYDVICTEYKQDTTIYHCINDKIEDDLINEFANNTHHSFPGQHQDSAIVLQFFKIISEIILTPSAPTMVSMKEDQQNILLHQHTYYPVYLSNFGEPPDLA